MMGGDFGPEVTVKGLSHAFDQLDNVHANLFGNENEIRNVLDKYPSLNKKLDPNLHQAMMEIEDETKEPGTIVQEIQKGFMMKDRLLRPSLVGVSKKKIDKELEKDKKTQENQPENEGN